MIRRAKILEIHDILSIARACAAHLAARGIYQWNEHYPTKQVFEQDIRRGELFIVENQTQIIGFIVISTLMDKEYEEVVWLTPSHKNVYIHRLAVHPEWQGRGYARQLMDFAENRARETNCVSIRLDTFSQNQRNQSFYQQRGYTQLGDIFFPEQSSHPFYCYELIL